MDSTPPADRFLEVACFNPLSVHVAKDSGADRIELCSDRATGGLTPTWALARGRDKLVDLRSLPMPVNVMIRVNADPSFRATRGESQQMVRQILDFRQRGFVSGFVFGVLDARGDFDEDVNRRLCYAAFPLPCTFHRAFDVAQGDSYSKLETVRRLGFTTILTSGCSNGDAIQGKDGLRRLVHFAKPMGMTVLVGGGVRSNNVRELLNDTGATNFHTSGIVSDDEYVPEEVQHLMLDPRNGMASSEEISRIQKILETSGAPD